MPNDNAVQSNLAPIESELSDILNIVSAGLSVRNIAQGHVKVSTNSNVSVEVFNAKGPAIVGIEIFGNGGLTADANVQAWDGSRTDANRIGRCTVGANQCALMCAYPCNVLDRLIVDAKGDGTAFVDVFIWMISAKPVTNPSIQADHSASLEEATPNTNTNDGTAFVIEGDSLSQTKQVLLEFDLSEQPFGREVDVATLRLVSASNYTITTTLDIFTVLKVWEHDQATWNDRVTGTAWSTPGLGAGTDREASPIAQIATPFTTNQIIELDVTAQFQEWINQTQSNNGLYLKFPAGVSGLQDWTCHGVNSGTSDNRPRIDVVYK